MTKNILFVGVGGQGIILASKVLVDGLLKAGYDVKMSEVHGMAQRGGSVTTQVRFGEKVYSPIIRKGEADVLVSFETMEAMRWVDYLKPDGKVVINEYEIPSVPILMGKEEYPKGIIEKLRDKADVVAYNAAEIAKALGNIKAQNMVLLGSLIKVLGIKNIDWDEVLRDNVKERFFEMNQKAIKQGMEKV